MRQSLHDFMGVGIVQFMAYPSARDADEYIHQVSAIVNDDFFSGIEISTPPNEEATTRVAVLLKSASVSVGFGAQPILLGNKANLNALDSDERYRAIEIMKSAIDQAYRVGAQKLGLLSGPDPGATKREQATALLVDSLNELCVYAETQGNLALTMELFDHATDKCCLIGPTSRAAEVAKEIRKEHPSFGLMVDLSHLPMQGESPAKALHTVKDYLIHAHIGNCVVRDQNDPLYGDKHPRFGYPGGEVGVVELTEYLRSLLDIGYLHEGADNILAYEIKPVEGESSETIIAQAKRTLRQAWQRV